MKKKVIWVIVILVAVLFFFPKNKRFGCDGIICSHESFEKMKLEEEKVICFGFRGPTLDPVTDVDTITCYGIFIN